MRNVCARTNHWSAESPGSSRTPVSNSRRLLLSYPTGSFQLRMCVNCSVCKQCCHAFAPTVVLCLIMFPFVWWGCKPSHHQEMWDVALGEAMFVEGRIFDSNVSRKCTRPFKHACGTALLLSDHELCEPTTRGSETQVLAIGLRPVRPLPCHAPGAVDAVHISLFGGGEKAIGVQFLHVGKASPALPCLRGGVLIE